MFFARDPDALRSIVVFGVIALSFLAIAVHSLTRLAGGPWALLGVVGGVVAAISPGIECIGLIQARYGDSASILTNVFGRKSVADVLVWTDPVGIALVAAAFVLGTYVRRTGPNVYPRL